MTTGQRCHVRSAAGRSIVACVQKPVTGFAPPLRAGMVDGLGPKLHSHLKLHVCHLKTTVRPLSGQSLCESRHILELGARLQVRAILKQANAHSLQTGCGNEVEDVIVGEQWKGEIGAS